MRFNTEMAPAHATVIYNAVQEKILQPYDNSNCKNCALDALDQFFVIIFNQAKREDKVNACSSNLTNAFLWAILSVRKWSSCAIGEKRGLEQLGNTRVKI